MKKLSDYALSAEQQLISLGLADKAPLSLYPPIQYAFAGGGKRLRPGLLLMANDAFGGAEENALKAAAGIEMFHNFTLLHDDVMDNSDTRHGRPAVHKKWDENVAILSGDTMLTMATQLLMEVPDKALREVLSTFNRMAIEVYEGQALDMEFEKGEDVTVARYLDMISKKTGALLGAAAKIGALIADASLKDADLMYDYGMNLGLAFQIKDDYLDVYGDPATFGKPIGGDINNGKQTFLLIKGLERNDSLSQALAAAMTLPVGEKRVKAVKKIYSDMGMEKVCEEAIQHYSALAMKSLKATSMGSEALENFRKLTQKMTGRVK